MEKMEKISKTFNLGKVDLYGTGKRYPVEITATLKKCGGAPTFTKRGGDLIPTGEMTPTYWEFTATGNIANAWGGGSKMGGQCLDAIAAFAEQMTPDNRAKCLELVAAWRAWHLNGMHAGTPEQEAAVKAWEACGNKYDYIKACEFLKQIGLYEMPYNGLSVGKVWHGEPYRYGCAWLVREIPSGKLAELRAMIEG